MLLQDLNVLDIPLNSFLHLFCIIIIPLISLSIIIPVIRWLIRLLLILSVFVDVTYVL